MATPRRLVLLAALVFAVLGLRPDAAGASAAECTTGEGEVATGSVLVQVVFPSGTFTRCVAPGGNGLDVLRRAGLAIEVQSFGAKGGAVCGITDPEGTFVGCPDGLDCLKCPSGGGGSRYWGYFRCYTYSPVGAGSTTPAGGTIESWRYGGGGGWSGEKPAACDDGRVDRPPPTDPTPSSAPTPTTRPPGGGGVATPRPGEPGADPTQPSGGTDGTTPAATTGPDGSTTTTTSAPDGSTTTTTTRVDGDEEPVTGGAGGARGSWDPTDEDERADGETASGSDARSDAGGGGGRAPVVPLAVTGLVVAGVAALAVRARRSRAVTAT